MKRKLLSIMLIAMLLFTFMPVGAFAAEGIDVVVATVNDVKAGAENVEVTVSLETNPGVQGFQFTVGYDSKLSLVDCQVDDEFGKLTFKNDKVIVDNNAEVSKTCEIVRLYFNVASDAVGEYKISLEDAKFVNSDGEKYDVNLTNGAIIVIGAETEPKPSTYTVTVNGGKATPQTAAENDTVTITADAAPEGQEFNIWTCDVDVLFADAHAEETNFKMPAKDVTVTAHYKDKDEEKPAVEKVTVSFDANGGSGNMAAKTVEKGSPYTLPACGFTAPAEKKFKVWEVNGTEYKAADKITVTADTTVKAIWAAVPKYDVVVTNGTGDGSYEASQTVTITADSKSGYTFKEWTVVSGDVTPKNKDAKTTTFVMPAEAVEVEATYTKNSYSGGGGSSSGSGSSSSSGSAVVTKPDTTIILTIDKLVSTVNGQEIISDVAPIIVDGRTYTPARFVAEQLGAKVDWNEETQLVPLIEGVGSIFNGTKGFLAFLCHCFEKILYGQILARVGCLKLFQEIVVEFVLLQLQLEF